MEKTITLIKPDDWHVHVRDGAALPSVMPDLSRRFARAIIMPNLNPPATTTDHALAYRDRILAALPAGTPFQPLMTLYLTEATEPAEIRKAKASGFIHGVKLYPAGATTHSHAGVHDIRKVHPILDAMQDCGIPLLVHGEIVDPDIDIFDREHVFIERALAPTLDRFPTLKCVFEHITTEQAVSFVRSRSANVGATITAHHLLYNRNAILAGGIRPHYYCAPVLKRERHRQALLTAATSGDARFFLGTDSAPHPVHAKLSACGCAGIYTGHAAIELYAEAFESVGSLDRLEQFASLNGARFYGLPVNQEKITLRKQPWSIPTDYALGADRVVPLRAGEQVSWQLG
jgi:dihydroorotase